MLQPSDVTDICPDAILHKRGEKYIVLMPEDLEEEERKIRALCDAENVDYEVRYRQVCDVFSRVVGYMQPLNLWNDGKKSEYEDRKMYKPDKKTFTPPTSEDAQRTLAM